MLKRCSKSKLKQSLSELARKIDREKETTQALQEAHIAHDPSPLSLDLYGKTAHDVHHNENGLVVSPNSNNCLSYL